MEKIKQFLAEHFGKLVGTTITSFLVRIVIAIVSFYTGSATDIGDAVGQALDKERSIAAAVELINETPKEELIEAVEAEKKENE